MAPFNTSIRSNWIVHFKFIACIKLLNISRINLKIRCSYENLNHFSRERISNWLDIPASRSCQFLVSKFQKRVGRCDFGFYCLEKKNSQMLLNQSIRIQALRPVLACDLWNIPLTHSICTHWLWPDSVRSGPFKEARYQLFGYLKRFNVIIGK